MKKYFLILCLLISSAFMAQSKYVEPNSEELLIQVEQAGSDVEKLPLLIKLFNSYETSDHEKMMRYAEEAISLANKLDDDQALAAAYSAKARSYSYTSEFDNAIDNYMLALKNANISKDQSLLYNIRGSLGNTYYQLYQNAKAKEHYEYAYKLAESGTLEQKEKKMGAILLNIGNIHLEEEELVQAEANYSKALEFFRAIEYKVGIADALLNLAILHSSRDSNWALAFPLLEESLLVHEKIDHPRSKVNLLNSLADYHLYNKQYDQAITYTRQMLALSKDIGAKHFIALGEETLSVIYEQQKDYEKALAAKGASQQLRDEIFTDTTVSKIAEIETQLETLGKENQISDLGAALSKSTARQKYTSIVGLVIVIIISLMIWLVHQQKRKLKKRFISIKEENEILKQSNLSLKDRLLKLANKIEQARSSQAQVKNEKYFTSSLKKEEKQAYINTLLNIMEQERPHLNTALKLNELAEISAINSHQLSELLNETIGKNFYEFINTYRVEEAKTIMSSPETQNKKLLSIAYESGFNSKASFNRAFKEITGITPSAYKKRASTTSD